jgi:WD40 repeat protein
VGNPDPNPNANPNPNPNPHPNQVGNIISRNQHFDTDFASWSEVGKLVLGLTDGNFAVWDLRSNETFMSRGKHFSGKLKEGITCGAWGPEGEVLALGSANQLKVSRPMSSASWEHTAAKLHQPHKVSPYPYPSPNPFPSPTPDPNPQP